MPINAGAVTLILGFDPRTTLAVARSLHRKKIPVIVGTISAWETPLRSCAIRAYVRLPGLDRPAGEFLSALLGVAERFGIDTIMPVNDRALMLIARHYDSLSARLQLACPQPGQIASVLNKETTAVLAAGLGIPVPVSIRCENWADLEVQKTSLKFPLFAKSRDKAEEGGSSQNPHPQLHRFDDYPAMQARLAVPNGFSGGLLLQEYCPGDDVGLAVLMHGGEALMLFQHRALRTYPIAGGVGVLARTEKVDTRMADCAVRLLRSLAWEGVAQLDFRHDPATGCFVLLEVNGRFWGSLAVSGFAGLDFPHAVWQLVHDMTPARQLDYKTGLLVRWQEGDVRRLLEFGRQNGWSRIALVRELFRFLAGFRPGVRDMFWSWRDPLPGLELIVSLTRWWLVARWNCLTEKMKLRLRILPARERRKT